MLNLPMPIYTYQCEHCGQRFDAKQSFAEASLTVCPNCAGKIHRVIQPVGVVFKGSGFYINDSRSKQNLATSGVKKEDARPAAESGTGGADAPTNGTLSANKGSSESGSNGSSGDSASSTSNGTKDSSGAKSEAPAKAATETSKSTSSESK
jgi:putative FmdB family regulatory protein